MLIGRRLRSFTSRKLRKDAHLISLDVPGFEHTVLARTGTSDAAAFQHVFDPTWQIDVPTEPRLIFDLGAYVGYSSVHFALRHPEARIVAVEPERSNIALLRRNVSTFPHVDVVEGAVWPQSAWLFLADPGKGLWGMRVGSESSALDRVRAVTFMQLLERAGAEWVDLVKIDIEGSEVELFSEQAEWLRRVGTIAVEPHDRYRPGSREVIDRALAASGVRFSEVIHPMHVVFVRDDAPS